MSWSDQHFAEFFRANGQSLLRTAVLLSAGDQHAAEDLLQDALVNCLRKWPTRKIEFPAAYVRTTMARLAQRRRLSRSFPTPDLNDRAVPDTTWEVDQRDALLVALHSLAPRQRVAVVLRYWEGLSEAETAAALSCSVGTVKSQTHRGLRTLREAMGPSFPERSGTWGSLVTAADGDLS